MTDLQFDLLIAQIQKRCHSDLGRDWALKLKILDSTYEMEDSQRRINQFMLALEGGLDFSFEDLSDISGLLEEESYLVYDWEEFKELASNAYLACVIREKAEHFDELNLAKKLIVKLRAIPEIMQGFNRIFTPEGEVSDNASPELKQIRKQLFQLKGRIQRQMQDLLDDKSLQNMLQDRFVTQRDSRYVLPIKEASAPAVSGIVLARSASKNTVFIEPAQIVPLNNEMQLLKEDEKREVHRILSEFSLFIRSKKKELVQNQKMLSQLDYLYALARLGLILKLKVPKMVAEPRLSINGGRHPLLILRKVGEDKLRGYQEVIPFNLELGKDYNLLLLSGPNTGGKTVLMKAVGIITLMALSGLPIPADEDSEIGHFTGVYADIGDDQSIENALSTFSSHLDKIGKMMAKADEKSLVLIDEIGAATDPQQGSALAQAILERLAELKTKGIITTHYTALKVFGEQHPNCINASMQFDLKSLLPTYHFQPGLPGDSFAIEVAASLGIDEALIKRAKELSGSQNLEFGQLLKKMQEERKALSREVYQYELKSRNLEHKLKELEDREELWEKELKERRKKHLKEMQDELVSFQKLYNKEISEVKELDKAERKRLSERKLHNISQHAAELKEEIMQISGESKRPLKKAVVGEKVWVPEFDGDGTITEVKGESITVDINGILYKTRLKKLYQSGKSAAKPSKENVQLKTEATAVFRTELMLLGMTFDEAMPLIDEFLANAVLGGYSVLRIVHGKGTGALRMKVRSYLKKQSIVKSIETPPAFEGGDGATIVRL